MRRLGLAFGFVVLALGLAGAGATPIFKRGGAPAGGGGGGGGGTVHACDVSNVCADFSNGQAYVTWPDAATGSAGAAYRYRMYRDTAPINAGNYTSATLIASYILNNSGQLLGGSPDITGGQQFHQINRQTNNSSNPMAKIPDVLSGSGAPPIQLAYGTGLQVYSAIANGTGYYAIVRTDTSDANPSFIGSVGPIAETTGTWTAVKFADSLSRVTLTSYGKITLLTTNIPTVFLAHQSDSDGGCAGNCVHGDYWEGFLTPDGGPSDGRQTVWNVEQDKTESYAQTTMLIADRDTMWGTNGLDVPLETFHFGIGMTPTPRTGAANTMYPSTPNRLYPSTMVGISKFLNFAIAKYGLDTNQIHWAGKSMGGWGGPIVGMHMASPKFSALWLGHPIWRMDHRATTGWAGNVWGDWPFKATVAPPASTLGITATNVKLSDETVWGGDGNYADIPNLIASNPGTDIPVAIWDTTKNDPFASWPDQLTALAAFRSAKRGHAFAWFMGAHDTGLTRGLVDCDFTSPDTGACYHKADFQLNVPYPVLDNSSIADNPGTGATLANGLYDGDYSGCDLCGFRWSFTTDTSSNLAFTISNAYMGRTPPAPRLSTTTGTIASSGSGSVTVADGTQFSAVSSNFYFLVGDTVSDQEAVLVTSVVGNTVNFSARGQLGSTAKAHASGVAIRQFVAQPTAPNGGPYTTMTVDITPRRLQGFIKANGTVLNCTYTPFGGSATPLTPTVDANGLFTLVGVVINVGQNTAVACS